MWKRVQWTLGLPRFCSKCTVIGCCYSHMFDDDHPAERDSFLTAEVLGVSSLGPVVKHSFSDERDPSFLSF